MRTEVCHICLDRSERGAVISGLNVLRDKRDAEGKTNELIDSLLDKIQCSQIRKARVYDEAR